MCGGDGHTESLQLTYDPSRLSYNDILQVGTGLSSCVKTSAEGLLGWLFIYGTLPICSIL